jgi:hypothetical protein
MANHHKSPLNGKHQPKGNSLPEVAIVTTHGKHTINGAGATEEDITEVMDEISQRVADGYKDMLGNLTDMMEENLVRLPEEAAKNISNYLEELTNEIQRAQKLELERQLADIEARFVRPFEDFAFSDSPIFDVMPSAADSPSDRIAREQLILGGANSTLGASRRLRTKEIIKNLDVAPLYYSVALFLRWVRKVGYPPMILLMSLKNVASVIKSSPS